jgi:hypothetical protein
MGRPTSHRTNCAQRCHTSAQPPAGGAWLARRERAGDRVEQTGRQGQTGCARLPDAPGRVWLRGPGSGGGADFGNHRVPARVQPALSRCRARPQHMRGSTTRAATYRLSDCRLHGGPDGPPNPPPPACAAPLALPSTEAATATATAARAGPARRHRVRRIHRQGRPVRRLRRRAAEPAASIPGR